MKHAAALPIGIFLVGGGAILLFIAFHNLPTQVQNFTDLASFLRAEVGKGKLIDYQNPPNFGAG